jgi:long-chain acyl-CoA synthetase
LKMAGRPDNISVTRVFDLLGRFQAGRGKKAYPVFGYKKDGTWHTISSEEYIDQVQKLSRGLWQLGIRKGDRVATVLRNGPEWNYLDMALLRIGAVQVPIYPTISNYNIQYIFQDAAVSLVFLADDELRERLAAVNNACNMTGTCYTLQDEGEGSWKSLFLDDPADDAELDKASGAVAPADLATVIYTSGTTGNPKGVMLTHGNIVSNFLAVSAILEDAPWFRKRLRTALSFLPLCHVYERILNYMYQNMGIKVYYVSSLEFLRESFTEVRPDILCAVPRVLEKSYERFTMRGKYLRGNARRLFVHSLHLAQRYELHRANGKIYALKLYFARLLVLRHWRKALGGRLRVVVSGGASLNEHLARTYWAAGIRVMEGYGLTETSPVVSVSTFARDGMKFGTVGPLIRGVSVKIADDGEILVKGPNVMAGYLNAPERTARVIDEDGWLHTGDVGMLVDGMYLRITDRKKEMFKTSGGKYIAPQVLETRFRESDFIENIIVVGERRNYAAALIVPNREYLHSWCLENGIRWRTDDEMLSDPAVVNRIRREVSRINELFDHTEQIKRFALVNDDWSVDSGELSPTLKLRRNELMNRYAGLIEAMYRNHAGISA